MSADVIQSTCADNKACTFAPGKCSILNVSPLGYTANYVCGYTDSHFTYLCNPGCCPGGVSPGFCQESIQPPPTCTDQTTCDAAFSGQACAPHLMKNGSTACGYIATAIDPKTGKIADMFNFCNPGCGTCKGTNSVGPCPGDSTTLEKVSFNNTRPVPNPWLTVSAKEVQEPILNRYFYAVIILLIALAIAGTFALI